MLTPEEQEKVNNMADAIGQQAVKYSNRLRKQVIKELERLGFASEIKLCVSIDLQRINKGEETPHVAEESPPVTENPSPPTEAREWKPTIKDSHFLKSLGIYIE
ncbi:MAG: hypothetical protein WCK48_00500 [bacterium]